MDVIGKIHAVSMIRLELSIFINRHPTFETYREYADFARDRVGTYTITADDGEIMAIDSTNILSPYPSYSYPYSGPIVVDSPSKNERIVLYPDGSMYYYDSGEMAWGNYQIIELNSRQIVIWYSIEGYDRDITLGEGGGYVWDSNGNMVEVFRWYVE